MTTTITLEAPDVKHCPWCAKPFTRPDWASPRQWVDVSYCSRSCARQRGGAMTLSRVLQARADRTAAVQELADAGLTGEQIAAALGVKPYSLAQWTLHHAPQLRERLGVMPRRHKPKPKPKPKPAPKPDRYASPEGLARPVQPPLTAFAWRQWFNRAGDLVEEVEADEDTIARLELRGDWHVTCLPCDHDWPAQGEADARRILAAHLDDVHAPYDYGTGSVAA